MSKLSYLIFACFLPISHLFASEWDVHDLDVDKTVSILSIDGGGTRGIVPTVLLGILQDTLDKDLIKYFDVTAGTSTGSLIAMGLNVPRNPEDEHSRPLYSPDDIVGIYESRARKIFSPEMKNYCSLWGILRPQYATTNLVNFANDFYGNVLFSQSITKTLIPVYDVSRGRPTFLASRLAKADVNKDYLMKNLALAATAAPSYFASHTLHSLGGQTLQAIDGGVVRNNPDISALAEACQAYPDAQKMIMVSLGTGQQDMQQTLLSYSPYYGQWVWPLTKIFMNAPTQAAEEDARRMMIAHNRDYYRLQLTLPSELMNMDNGNPENLEKLKEVAMDYAFEHYDVFENIAETLRILKEDSIL